MSQQSARPDRVTDHRRTNLSTPVHRERIPVYIPRMCPRRQKKIVGAKCILFSRNDPSIQGCPNNRHGKPQEQFPSKGGYWNSAGSTRIPLEDNCCTLRTCRVQAATPLLARRGKLSRRALKPE